VDPRLGWLGIALNPELWRFCRRLTNQEAGSLYGWSAQKTARRLGVSLETAASIRQTLDGTDPASAVHRLEGLEIDFLTLADNAYPAPLRDIYDPPVALFIRGSLAKAPDRVAMVGSRRCTSYGRSVALELAEALAHSGVTVVSGLARGIDSAAHEGALKSGTTIAVLGCGLDITYPPENHGLVERVAAAGAVISEYPPGTPPRALNFPARNRIISGLSAAVVVVEASLKSGAMITVDFALEQGKEVLAVPGSVRSPASAGCHELLKEGAAPVGGPADVLEAIGRPSPPAGGESIRAAGALTSTERALLELIDYDKTHIDLIMIDAERPADEVLSALSILEVKGFIGRQAGGWFCRLK
jgi:DNA processing protein